MKAEELMIGDYIKHGFGGIGKVTELSKGIVTVYDKGLDDGEGNCEVNFAENEIQPIPLTPDILEKNGFYYGYTSNEYDIASITIAQLDPEDKGWVWDDGDGSVKVIFPNEADGGMIAIDDQGFDRHLDLVFCECIFVHELQHALRLCGIEKTIEL